MIYSDNFTSLFIPHLKEPFHVSLNFPLDIKLAPVDLLVLAWGKCVGTCIIVRY